MAATRFVGLLRGINVGGNNLIKMTELKACLEKAGFDDVMTYIQSGNVIFSSGESSRAKLGATWSFYWSRSEHRRPSKPLRRNRASTKLTPETASCTFRAS